MYSSHGGILPNVDSNFVASVEPLLLNYQVKVQVKKYNISCDIVRDKKMGLSDLINYTDD
jgi:acid phosphatase type 7